MFGFKEYIRELTVSPDYRQGNVFNPFYDMSKKVTDEVIKQLGKEVWKFKSVHKNDVSRLKELKSPTFGRGGYYFQIIKTIKTKDQDTDYYIKTAKVNATGHFGMRTRKSATASSNINELMTLYFLVHTTEKAGTEAEATLWYEGDAIPYNTTGSIGVVKAESTAINYEGPKGLRLMLEGDTTAVRDIQIGWHNARAVEKDLLERKIRNVESYHWVPVNKPGDISKRNPSDIILCLDKTNKIYTGYSNKASAGKDTTPKFNTNINAFYSQLGDATQLSSIQTIMDVSWNHAAGLVSATKINATRVLNQLNKQIENADYTESNLKVEFAELGKAFNMDELNFYGEDFYYPYRNILINYFSDHLENAENLSYFLKTISGYTFASGGTPCPYKLLVGTTTSSTITDVSSDDTLRSILDTPSKDLTSIVSTYGGTKQSFKLDFTVGDKNVHIPITVRTRATGGWSGKSLYIETSGVKVT